MIQRLLMLSLLLPTVTACNEAVVAGADATVAVDAGSPQPGPDASFVCPEPLPTAIPDAGPSDDDAGAAPGGMGPPIQPETCWEATSDWPADFSCTSPDWTAPECGDGLRINRPANNSNHIYLPEPIDYQMPAPTGGAHRPSWARWGEYTYLPTQRYLHNLEHGGIAFLYHPCASDETLQAIRDYVQSHAGDETGPFRYVMTPYPGLPTAIAVLAWENKLSANCFNSTDVDWFLRLNYRNGPEDVAVDGRYIYTWQRH
jgi:hypothetical protein